MNYTVNEDFIRDNPNLKIYGNAQTIVFNSNNFTCINDCDYDDVSNIDNNIEPNISVEATENSDYTIVE